jgi:hypothetical protein
MKQRLSTRSPATGVVGMLVDMAAGVTSILLDKLLHGCSTEFAKGYQRGEESCGSIARI